MAFLLMASAVLVLAANASVASAASHTLTLDPAATEVGFLLEATGHDVEGHLALDSGVLHLEPNAEGTGGVASGELILNARLSETGNAKRDKKMHQEVLESESHPQIVFRAEHFEGAFPSQGQGEVKVRGRVELLGTQHPLTLQVGYQLEGDTFAADVDFDVPFVEWGLKDPSILFLRVSKVVKVHAKATGSWQEPATTDAMSGAEGR